MAGEEPRIMHLLKDCRAVCCDKEIWQLPANSNNLHVDPEKCTCPEYKKNG